MRPIYRQLSIAGIFALGAFVGSVVWYRGVTYLSAELASIEAALAAEALQGGSPPSRTALEQLVLDEALVQSYFVSEENVPAFINDLEARGRARGTKVTIGSVAKQGAEQEAVLTLTLTIKGSFDDVMQTVGAIEYAPYALSLSSLVLVRELDSAWRADLKLSVSSPPPLTTTP